MTVAAGVEASAPALRAEGLVKRYGATPALAGVSFSLPRGSFLSLFGPNGAGKTTLLRVLCGLATPSAGEAWIGEERIASGDSGWRRRIGVLSHQTFLYGGLTAAENLRFYAALYSLPEAAEHVRRALGEVELDAHADRRVRGFSRGMQQRLALARTLLHDPDIVLLDEPYTGLDPHGAAMLRALLERLRDGRRTVVLITHNLSQGLELADRVAVQVGGRWVFDAPRADITPGAWEAEYTHLVGAAA